MGNFKEMRVGPPPRGGGGWWKELLAPLEIRGAGG